MTRQDSMLLAALREMGVAGTSMTAGEERMVAREMVREAVASMRLVARDVKWESPRGRRKEWRRKKPDGSYEYSYEPPEGRKGPAKDETEKDDKKEKVVEKVKEKVKEKVEEKKRKHLVRLSHDELKTVLSKGHYSIVSAGRSPNDPKEAKMKPDDEFFHKRHEQLKDELEKKGYDYAEVVGHYGGKEASFMVFHDGTEITPKSEKSVMVRHASREEMEARLEALEELGRKFKQDSVLHGSKGKNTIVFTTGEKKGKECGGKGWEEKPGAKDFYTDMKTEDRQHTKFMLNVDGCFKKGLLSAERVAALWEAIAAVV